MIGNNDFKTDSFLVLSIEDRTFRDFQYDTEWVMRGDILTDSVGKLQLLTIKYEQVSQLPVF